MKRQMFTSTKLMSPVFLAIIVLLLAAPSTIAQDIPTESNSNASLNSQQHENVIFTAKKSILLYQ
jgi:hypothetical protein